MEGNRSGTGKRSSPKDEFADLVLSWSLQDIFNDNLYKYQVDKIPKSFESVDQYLGSYIFPLLEETRAELASAMETIHEAPFAEVASFSELINEESVYDVKVDQWRNVVGDYFGHKILPGDVVLLSDSKPETISRPLLGGGTHIFAFVRNIKDDEREVDSCTSSNFKLKTANRVEVGNGRSRKSLYVVYLMSIIPHKRIWNALRTRHNLNIIQKSLAANHLEVETCEFCPLKYNNETEEKLGSALSSKLNESQLEAITDCLSKIECSHKSSVELIWGPPGTGKTATLSSLLYVLLKMNVRTLVCAPTNIAIKELASRVIALVRNSSEENHCLSCPLGEMLMFGNKDRLKFGSDTEEIYLDYRVDKLVHCLLSRTGWKNCFASMRDFLEDNVPQHRIFVENNELIEAKKSHENEEDNNNKRLTESKPLLEFARDRFAHLATPVRDCMSCWKNR